MRKITSTFYKVNQGENVEVVINAVNTNYFIKLFTQDWHIINGDPIVFGRKILEPSGTDVDLVFLLGDNPATKKDFYEVDVTEANTPGQRKIIYHKTVKTLPSQAAFRFRVV